MFYKLKIEHYKYYVRISKSGGNLMFQNLLSGSFFFFVKRTRPYFAQVANC